MSRIVSNKIDTLVVSYGGVGTTFLSEFIGKYRSTNCPYDTDGLKHLPLQPMARNADFRVVYVYGDPVEAVASLFRRNYHATQARKTRRSKWLNRPSLNHHTTIEEFANLGSDEFGLEAHFDQWLENPMGYQQIFVRYNEIWESLTGLLEFLNIPQSAATTFPPQKQRSTSLQQLGPRVLERLESIYAELRQKSSALPSPHVQVPDPSRKQGPKKLLSPYGLAVASETLFFYLKQAMKNR